MKNKKLEKKPENRKNRTGPVKKIPVSGFFFYFLFFFN